MGCDLKGKKTMEFRIDDKLLDASLFLPFVDQVWPGAYDMEKTESALAKTLNITAYDGDKLVGWIFLRDDH